MGGEALVQLVLTIATVATAIAIAKEDSDGDNSNDSEDDNENNYDGSHHKGTTAVNRRRIQAMISHIVGWAPESCVP